jgi:GNAT superfamily N-acetyltransferase
MPTRRSTHLPRLDFHPLTKDRWADFEQLFGERGACGGCWCMLWRLKRSEFEQRKGAGNRQAMKALVEEGHVPGILAYANQEPIGWCAVAPRTAYPALERSRILRRIDDEPVWSVTCFFVKKEYRRMGVTVRLLQEAVKHVRAQGGGWVEGYPVEPRTDQPIPAAFAWTGLTSAFLQAGFTECERRSDTRPIMRCQVRQPRKRKGRRDRNT